MRFLHEKLEEILKVLNGSKAESLGMLDGFTYMKSDYRKPNELPVDDGWENFIPGTKIYDEDVHFWFHKKFKTCKAQENKTLQFNVSTHYFNGWYFPRKPQLMVFLNGELYAGMDIKHREIPLEFDTEYDMYIYYYVAPMYYGTEKSSEAYVEFRPSLSLIDSRVEKLIYDISVPFEASKCFDETDVNYKTIIKYLNAATSFLDLRKPRSDEFYKSIALCDEYLQKEFYTKKCGKSEAIVGAIGHTHIDVAWLWTYAQTAEKAQRSFATVVNLMKRYPEYKFMSSQPQLYKYVKTHSPELYEEIKKLVKEGRWEVEGAMWVEADCNLTSGEGLVRQILYGKKFIKEEFGKDSKILWLPDVFGYSAALPQILKKSGVDKFVTSKISWNQYNKMPYDTFMWRGIDGSEVFTYFLTAQDYVKNEEPKNYTTYNGNVEPKQVLGTWKRYQQKEYNNEVMLTFGWGDGGGGPEKDMLEKLVRLSCGIPGIPKTEIMFSSELLEHVQNNFSENCRLLNRIPKWTGELYLEHHRGTYTSISKNKKNNRKAEFLYQKTEGVSVISELLLKETYPQNEINDAWEVIMLNQFHDVLPGTSIKEVYEDSDNMYAEIFNKADKLLEQKITAIADNIDTEGGIFVYNPNSFAYSGAVMHDEKCFYAENIPSFGWKVILPTAENKISVTEKTIENRYYKIVFDDCFDIISLYDKEYDREVVKERTKLNQLQVFDDTPHREYDAWETASYVEDKMWHVDCVESVELIDEGERAGLCIKKNFMSSVIEQKIFVYENSRRIDFVTTIDWHDEHLLLKAVFPFNVNTNRVTYDIQFGNVERPTYKNTSWEAAKFEVCAHKWADVSDGDYGVSVLNDCKYGHSAEGSTLKLSLLKSPTWPNKEADKGKQEFMYSLYPHKGDFRTAGTVKESYKINQPPIVREIKKQSGTLPSKFSLLHCSSDNVIIETVKKAEVTDDIIIRMYETHNTQGKVKLKLSFDFKDAYLCDLLENNEEKLVSNGNELEIPIKGFEIITIKIVKNKE